jgi:diamine N-acetyltransferase
MVIFCLFVVMNKNVSIRVINVSDFELLKQIELDVSNKKYSDLNEQLNEDVLFSFINSNHDIYSHNQLKFTILENNKRAGFVDLYEVDFKKNRAGIGIIILPEYRRRHIATSAINEVIKWSNKIGISHYFAEVEKSNISSLHLFEKAGFHQVKETQDYYFLDK